MAAIATKRVLEGRDFEAATLAGGKDGLVGYLRAQAIENPGPFMALLGKALPIQCADAAKKPTEPITQFRLTIPPPGFREV